MKTRIIKRLNSLVFFGFCVIAGLMMFTSCKKDSVDPNLPKMKLVPEMVSGKSGHLYPLH